MKKQTSKYLIGAGVAAAVAAGIVGFVTQTKKGKQIAKHGKRYAGDIAKDVARKAENLKKVTREAYGVLIDEVVEEYEKKKKLPNTIARELASELKKEWEVVKKELKKK